MSKDNKNKYDKSQSKKGIYFIVVVILFFIFLGVFYYQEEVTFKNSQFEHLIRSKINKSNGKIIKKNLNDIVELDFSNKNIYNLDDLKYFNNLEKLNLKNTKVAKLPTDYLNNLKYLNIFNSEVEDLDIINELNELKNKQKVKGDILFNRGHYSKAVNIYSEYIKNSGGFDKLKDEYLLCIKKSFINDDLNEYLLTVENLMNNIKDQDIIKDKQIENLQKNINHLSNQEKEFQKEVLEIYNFKKSMKEIKSDISSDQNHVNYIKNEIKEINEKINNHKLLYGYIVQKVDNDQYEVINLLNREHVILETSFTEFIRKGKFKMWVIRLGSEEVVVESGFSERWPVYVEVKEDKIEKMNEKIEVKQKEIKETKNDIEKKTRLINQLNDVEKEKEKLKQKIYDDIISILETI